VKNRSLQVIAVNQDAPAGFPSLGELAALRAWYEGVSSREAVDRYLGAQRTKGESSRGVIRRIRQALIAFASTRHHADLVELLDHPDSQKSALSRKVFQAIDYLRDAPVPEPLVTDDIGKWFPARTCQALQTHGIRTLADLTVRVPRRRMWWAGIDGLGSTGAKHIEAFFAQHPQLTERARALIPMSANPGIVPWEVLRVPEDVDGSNGAFRAPRKTCSLNSDNDYQAVHAWLSLHETPATLRAYRKEAERLILWAVLERGVAMSSLTKEDAVAYRAFLRRPASRWVGPSLSRTSPEWRPFTGPLAPRSVAYALSVLGAMYRWLTEQGYVLTNPFAGIKVRGATRTNAMETHHVFSEGEWALIRTIADGLEWSYGWTAPAAQRLRFILDFAYATGLRISELVGKGSKPGKVALPPLARSALQRYLVQRGLPTTPSMWIPTTKLIGAMDLESQSGISATRLWVVMKRFFETAAGEVAQESPALAEKLRQATPHWMRHTHATHALARGAELTSVRDNLRHASIATTSIYLHGDDLKRANQMGSAFLARE
jgi:site-specific recombinase XerD